MAADARRPWVLLSGSGENRPTTAAHGFAASEMKKRRHDQAHRMTARLPADELEHIGKGPPEHCRLAFQGRPRMVCDGDAALLMGRTHAAAGALA